ncbi:hypothetical protein [Sporolactobacillus laevolacticus]|nr:hypothetical protein [Sporolactobacillus laevolacticus]MDN3954055.1 hypothetical protein [Sporolactobacillus laevolacticus]
MNVVLSNWQLYITHAMPWIVTGILLCFIAFIAIIYMNYWKND